MAHLTAVSTGNLSLDARLYGPDTSISSSSGSSSNASLGGGHASSVPSARASLRNLGNVSVGAGIPPTGGSQGLIIPITVVGSGSIGGASNAELSNSPVSDIVPGGSKLAGLHGWLTGENKRVKSWWAARSGTDLHRLYMTQLQDTDGELHSLVISVLLLLPIYYIIFES